jgi:predicted RNA-binding protein YlqC (UPF0109 family)
MADTAAAVATTASPADVTVHLSVPGQLAGRVIGRGGATVDFIKRRACVSMSTESSTRTLPRRVMTVRGQQVHVAAALAAVAVALTLDTPPAAAAADAAAAAQTQTTQAPGGTDSSAPLAAAMTALGAATAGGGDTANAAVAALAAQELSISLLITPLQASYLIGKGGRTIKATRLVCCAARCVQHS